MFDLQTSARTMTLLRLRVACCLLVVVPGDAFSINHVVIGGERRCCGTTPLFSVIRPDETDFTFDEGSGGVRLAEESVIQVLGQVKHGPGKADPALSDLRRYRSLTSLDEATVTRGLSGSAGKILGTGRGTELYKDPGETVLTETTLAPLDAVRDCLMGVASCQDYSRLVINFCGGGDAQVLEVLAAIKELVLDLDAKTKAQIDFHSISHSSIDSGRSYVTVVGLNTEPDKEEETDGDTGGGGLRTGVERSLAEGQVYFADGQYWTVTEDDRNYDVE